MPQSPAPRPKAILLDLDNTLYPYAPCHRAGLRAAWRASALRNPAWKDSLRFRDDYDKARDQVKMGLKGQAASHSRLLYFKRMAENAYGKSDLATASVLHEVYLQAYAKKMRTDEGCPEFLRQARAAGITLCLVTNMTTEWQVSKLQRLGLSDAFDWLFTSEELGGEKPNPSLLRRILESIGADAAQTWVFGDDWKHDIEPALALGMKCFWYVREPRATRPGKANRITSWKELPKWLDAGKNYRAS
jgi:putative hydrolase of the HAD superfamily